MSTLQPLSIVHAVSGAPPGGGIRTPGDSLPIPDRLHPLQWIAVVGFWFLFWLFNAAAHVSIVLWRNPVGNREFSVGYLLEEAVTVTIWVLFTPVIFWLSWHFPVNVRNWHWRVPLHLDFRISPHQLK